MRRRSIATVLLSSLAAARVSLAQIVGGQVVTDRAAPLRGAVVQLLDNAHAVVDSAILDSSGTFYLTAPKPGTYALRVSAAGLQPAFTTSFTLAANEFHQERIVLATVPNTRVYYDFEVQQAVTPQPGNSPPPYPTVMRNSRVEGDVLVQFVVDSTGRPVPGTTKVLKSTHAEFTKAVLDAIPGLRFNAARLGGHTVAQLVQMPFQFSLTP